MKLWLKFKTKGKSLEFEGAKTEEEKKGEKIPPHLKLGVIGENIAVKHFVKHKFKIIDRNYRKKYGEIDIIAKKDGTLHFIEVKTVSYETKFNEYFPEQNIHYSKKNKLAKIINIYLKDKKVSPDIQIKVDSCAVYFDPYTQNTKIRVMEDILLNE